MRDYQPSRAARLRDWLQPLLSGFVDHSRRALSQAREVGEGAHLIGLEVVRRAFQLVASLIFQADDRQFRRAERLGGWSVVALLAAAVLATVLRLPAIVDLVELLR